MIFKFKKSIPNISFLETKKTWRELETLQKGYSNEKILKSYSNLKSKINPEFSLFYGSITNIASFGYKNNKKVKVIDFGGGSGNFFYYIKELFPDLEIEWTVIEQKYIVDFYKEKDLPIKHETLDQFKIINKCDILLCSGVLQFMKDYKSFIPKLINQFKAKEVILDRTFIKYKGNTNHCLQYVNKDICYPCYHYNKEELYSFFKDYSLFNEWESPIMSLYKSRNKFYFAGAVFKRL